MTRVLVTASRTWTDRRTVWDALYRVASDYGINGLIVVHGDAIGGDQFAQEWALANESEGVVNEPHPAQWHIGDAYNAKAGIQRNVYMVDLGADICLAFTRFCTRSDCRQKQEHFTHGTTHCVGLALARNIYVHWFCNAEEKNHER